MLVSLFSADHPTGLWGMKCHGMQLPLWSSFAKLLRATVCFYDPWSDFDLNDNYLSHSPLVKSPLRCKAHEIINLFQWTGNFTYILGSTPWPACCARKHYLGLWPSSPASINNQQVEGYFHIYIIQRFIFIVWWKL